MTQFHDHYVPTRLLETGDTIHLAFWSTLHYQTRCGVSFDPDQARREEDSVSCMTCLVRVDLFEFPLRADAYSLNHFNERVWLKQVYRSPYYYTTECCFAEHPCNSHGSKELP